MKNIVVCLETLDIRTSAVIVAIAAQEVGTNAHFHSYVSIDSCLKHGMTVSERSLLTWAGSDVTTYVGSATLAEVLASFVRWLPPEPHDITFWFDSATYSDAATLANAFEKTGLLLPWREWNVGHLNTLYNSVPPYLLWRSNILPQHDGVSASAKAHAFNLERALKTQEGCHVANSGEA